jgi:hypothetical protein
MKRYCWQGHCHEFSDISASHFSKPGFLSDHLLAPLAHLPQQHLCRKDQSAGQRMVPFHRHPTLLFHFPQSFPVFPSFKRPTLHDNSTASPWTSLPLALSPTRLRIRKQKLLSGRLLRVHFDLQRRDVFRLFRALDDELNRVLLAGRCGRGDCQQSGNLGSLLGARLHLDLGFDQG